MKNYILIKFNHKYILETMPLTDQQLFLITANISSYIKHNLIDDANISKLSEYLKTNMNIDATIHKISSEIVINHTG